MALTSYYFHTATMAAHAERMCFWFDAIQLWEQSSLKAINPENYYWAKRRAEHCRAKMNASHLHTVEQKAAS
ncbi:ANR family transcriptional regulator [Serratia fonticola]|uniref:ANR family transcriptional regulator n=1 Tax=Serratia fonticola TaxID=47917 RepID=UPI001C47880B|nr:ANR family transcriptional regulator [Serratia fonticola]